jgi:hypothetical protein
MPNGGNIKKRIIVILMETSILLCIFNVFTHFLIPQTHASDDYPTNVTFKRTKYDQNWDGHQIAAANRISTPSDNMGLTLLVFLKGYNYDPEDEDKLDFTVLAMGIDQDLNLRSWSDYIIKEMKITLKKMSIEDNGSDYYNVYSYPGNYWITDHNAQIGTNFWRAQNVSYQSTSETAVWAQQLLEFGAEVAIGVLINSLDLGITGVLAEAIAGAALGALIYKKPVGDCNSDCWPNQYAPAFYKAVNNNPWDFWFSNSSASLGGDVSWSLLDDCKKNHRLEIIADMTYAQYNWYYGYWFDEHTIETSVTLSSVLGDGYLDSYDYEVKWGDVPYQENPGFPITKGYDAPNTKSPYVPRIYPGTLYFDIEAPNGDLDPYFGQREYLYSGYLNESGSDCHDWYVADICYKPYYQDNSAFIRLDVPGGADFDLEVYDLSTGLTYHSECRNDGTEEIIIATSSSRNFEIGVHIFQGSGEYILAAYAVYQHYLGGATPPGEGCPYIYVWNSSSYVLDNNVLGMSEVSNSSDVEDFYKLEQEIVPFYTGDYLSVYSLMLGEFENEHSYIDQVKLLAVDHSPNVNVAISPTGEILTYQNPSPPISVIDNYGNSWLDTVSNINNNYYRGRPDEYLLLDFGSLNASQAAKLVLRANIEFKKDMCIHVQTLNETCEWTDAVILRTRYHWSTIIVDLADYLSNLDGTLKMRLYFTGIHKIDYIGLDTTPQKEYTIHKATLVLAKHSENGLVTLKLLKSDAIYSELTPNQQIYLYFALSKQSADEQRTFIIQIKGHYYTINPR